MVDYEEERPLSYYLEEVKKKYSMETELMKVEKKALGNQPRKPDALAEYFFIRNVPITEKSRFEKIYLVLKKIYSAVGSIKDLRIPLTDGNCLNSSNYDKEIESVEEKVKTKGYAFLKYNDTLTTIKAFDQLSTHRLDRSHTLMLHSLIDMEDLANVEPVEEKDLAVKPFPPTPNVWNWACDADMINSYFTIFYDIREQRTMFNMMQMKIAKPKEVFNRFLFDRVKWSPLGTYLSSIHEQGSILWDKLKMFRKFEQKFIQHVLFSPCERFIVGYSPPDFNQVEENEEVVRRKYPIKIWSVISETLKREFDLECDEKWPSIMWNYNGEYFTRLVPPGLILYSSMDFKRKWKASYPEAESMIWAPTTNLIGLYCRASDNTPARIVLLDPINQTELLSKNPFTGVLRCELAWQNESKYFCARYDKYIKGKATTKAKALKTEGNSSTLEMFTIQQRGKNAIETMEFVDQKILEFSWEPQGNRFVIIQNAKEQGIPPRTSIYKFDEKNQKFIKFFSFDSQRSVFNTIRWSPFGQFLVLAHISANEKEGRFIIVDVNLNNETILLSKDLSRLSTIEWNSTGRFFAAVSYNPFYRNTYYHNVEGGKAASVECKIRIYSFLGDMLYESQEFNTLIDFQWRPRPKSLLPAEEKKKIRKNLGKFSVKYESDDALALSTLSEEKKELKKKQRVDFEKIVLLTEEYKKKYQEEMDELRPNRGGIVEKVEITVDEVINTTQQPQLLINCELVRMRLSAILRKLKRKEKEMRILILGLDNAGKTTILKRINGESIDEIAPTVGFNIKTIEFKNYKLNFWDVGGQKSIRAYWRNHFESTDGLIWVIDSADRERLSTCKNDLLLLLNQEKLNGATLLIFANKQDLDGSVSGEQLKETLELDKLTTHHFEIVECSAATGDNLLDGISWMINDISSRIFI
ncbi:hypothetical protein SNEBB_000551 [Seison nebaliae]|nr:hypothetical protein SNEBB_000551 [Seison nebaliae]